MYSKMQGRGAIGGNGLCECMPSSSKTTTSPFSTSRTYLRADDVERAGFRGQDRAAVEVADHQRTDAERIARADELLVGEADEGVGAFELAQALDEAVDEAVALGARHQMQDHFGVGGRLHDGAVAHQLAAQASARWSDCRYGRSQSRRRRARRTAAARCAGWSRRWSNSAHGRSAAMPGRRSITSRREKVSPTRPIRRSEWKRLPSKETMPAASWPRCWRACRPSAVIAAASGWPKMPKTPHSSRSRSPSRSRPASSRAVAVIASLAIG